MAVDVSCRRSSELYHKVQNESACLSKKLYSGKVEVLDYFMYAYFILTELEKAGTKSHS